jgi:3',5'-cyclic AMP phosphodiesterase CpdA
MKEGIFFRFLVASDGHYGEPGINSDQNYSQFIKWLEWERRENGLDLFIFNGDLVHDCVDSLKIVKGYFEKPGIPFLVIRGNHDLISEENWREIFGMNVNFLYTLKNIAFMSCATSNSSGEYQCADTEWLKKNIESSLDKKFLFVFLHISQGGWTEHGINCPDVMRLLDKYPQITAVFHGHDHQENDMKRSLNTIYLFDGYIGGSWGGNNIGYRIVEIYTNKTVRTYQYDPEEEVILNEIVI